MDAETQRLIEQELSAHFAESALKKSMEQGELIPTGKTAQGKVTFAFTANGATKATVLNLQEILREARGRDFNDTEIARVEREITNLSHFLEEYARAKK